MKRNNIFTFVCIILTYCFAFPAQVSGDEQKSIVVKMKVPGIRPESIPIGLVPFVYPLAIDTYSDPDDQFEFIKGYADGYKFSLIKMTYPKNFHSGLDKENTPFAEGYRQGKVQGFDDIQKNNERCTMVDFGYALVILTGKFEFGFEKSIFNTSKGEVYWVEFGTGARKDIPQGVKTSATGYLSLEGVYGHMGCCNREFVVIAVE